MTTQQMAGDTLSRRSFCALAGAGAFAQKAKARTA